MIEQHDLMDIKFKYMKIMSTKLSSEYSQTFRFSKI